MRPVTVTLQDCCSIHSGPGICPAVRVVHSTGRGFRPRCAPACWRLSSFRVASILPMSVTRFARCGRGRSTCRAASRSETPMASRARGRRTPRASSLSSREFVMQMADLPDARGHFGPYGGVFVAETLIRALDELTENYSRYRNDPAFRAEYARELKHYVGRPSPVYHAGRWSRELGG